MTKLDLNAYPTIQAENRITIEIVRCETLASTLFKLSINPKRDCSPESRSLRSHQPTKHTFSGPINKSEKNRDVQATGTRGPFWQPRQKIVALVRATSTLCINAKLLWIWIFLNVLSSRKNNIYVTPVWKDTKRARVVLKNVKNATDHIIFCYTEIHRTLLSEKNIRRKFVKKND